MTREIRLINRHPAPRKECASAAWASYELAVTRHDRVAAESTPAGQRVHAHGVAAPRPTWRLADPRSAPLETESEAPLGDDTARGRGVAWRPPKLPPGRAARVVPLPARGSPGGREREARRRGGSRDPTVRQGDSRRHPPGLPRMTARRNHRPGRA